MICSQCSVPMEHCTQTQRQWVFKCPQCQNEVDPHFICGGCGGALIEVERTEEGRKVYDCGTCRKNRMTACVICNYPRSIWADDGTICGSCMLGGIRLDELTEEQEIGLRKWAIEIPI